MQACKCSMVINLQLEGQLKAINFITVKIVHSNECITILITIHIRGTSHRHAGLASN